MVREEEIVVRDVDVVLGLHLRFVAVVDGAAVDEEDVGERVLASTEETEKRVKARTRKKKMVLLIILIRCDNYKL